MDGQEIDWLWLEAIGAYVDPGRGDCNIARRIQANTQLSETCGRKGGNRSISFPFTPKKSTARAIEGDFDGAADNKLLDGNRGTGFF